MGLTLCRAHHWAFDAGLFTLTSDYAVELSSLVQRADIRKIEMQSLAGKTIQLVWRGGGCRRQSAAAGPAYH